MKATITKIKLVQEGTPHKSYRSEGILPTDKRSNDIFGNPKTCYRFCQHGIKLLNPNASKKVTLHISPSPFPGATLVESSASGTSPFALMKFNGEFFWSHGNHQIDMAKALKIRRNAYVKVTRRQ